jgi:hypothetical protein
VRWGSRQRATWRSAKPDSNSPHGTGRLAFSGSSRQKAFTARLIQQAAICNFDLTVEMLEYSMQFIKLGGLWTKGS